MAFTYGFYNSVNHDRKYDAVQMGQIFDGIITDGIYATYLKAMVVKASSNASEVIVQPGRAWFNHTWSYNDADYPVAAPEPEVVLDRIDTLVLDINSEDASRTNSFLWVQGTPTSQVPEPPTLIHTATHNQYPLCDVYRQAGTTQIYAADITNRVGTSDCPFVTGVLEGIDIDDLLAQWDDEFHTWENATKASFEGWMVNQQAVYTAWWDALKAQMAGDVADVEAWIETIHDILDEEVATRLQAEIDEIKTELPSGSHITVTTTDTELYSRTVTITDEANHTVTSQFDATGVAVFKTVPYVGNLTISSTDGTRTATAVVQTPYFARYSFSIAFWSATVNIDGTSELGGETVTITDSSLALVGAVVLNASGLGVFNATYPDTYKFSVTHGGETMSVTLEVSQETTYNVEIHGGFNWQRWVDLSENYSSSDFNDLDELLADQKAVRELMTIHACVDYMADATRADANITQIINDDICAKWINLRDYALDTLYANSTIAAVMDTADKYFYGEWGIIDNTTTPPTWGPKGAVPVMTSNTAPYGEVLYSSSNTSYPAYKCFDGNESSSDYGSTASKVSGAGSYFGYSFTSPIRVKKILYNRHEASGNVKIKFQYSDDKTNWQDCSEEITINSSDANKNFYVDCSEELPHKHWRAYLTYTSESLWFGFVALQFYGRQLSVSVPVMTSNTAPFGEVISTQSAKENALYYPFRGHNNTSYYVTFPDGTTHNLGYKFSDAVIINRAHVFCAYYIKGKIQYSDDNVSWNDATVEKTIADAGQSIFDFVDSDFTEASRHKYWRFFGTQNTTGQGTIFVIQFYGLDYSEKEFEAGTTKKWLYDHGVRLDTLNSQATNAYASATDDGESLNIKLQGGSNYAALWYTSQNLTNYSRMRVKFGKKVYSSNSEACALCVINSVPSAGTNTRSAYMFYGNGNNDSLLPNNAYLDISSYNETKLIDVEALTGTTINKEASIDEWWLEND